MEDEIIEKFKNKNSIIVHSSITSSSFDDMITDK